MLRRWLLLSHMISNIYLLGIIWFIQCIHYPLLSGIGTIVEPAMFKEYTHYFTIQPLLIAGIPMLIDFISTIILFWRQPPPIQTSLYKLSGILLGIIWGLLIFEFFVHQILSQGYHVTAYRFLQIANWAITILWSIKSILSIIFVKKLIHSLHSSHPPSSK